MDLNQPKVYKKYISIKYNLTLIILNNYRVKVKKVRRMKQFRKKINSLLTKVVRMID